MSRYDEVLKAVCPEGEGETVLKNLVKEYCELENRLDELRALPQILIHPTDRARQKPTAAHKMYKELLQQYSNIAKILSRNAGIDNDTEDSPLRAWAKSRTGKNDF